MLGEAVAELGGARRVAAAGQSVDAQVDAYIPAAYIAAEAAKVIDLHRRIALAESDDELRELRAAVEDRFSPIRSRLSICSRSDAHVSGLPGSEPTTSSCVAGERPWGPLALGSAELRELRRLVDTAVYTSAKREVSQRVDSLAGAPAGRFATLIAARGLTAIPDSYAASSPFRSVVARPHGPRGRSRLRRRRGQYDERAGDISSENVPANAVAIVAGTPILRTDFERFFGQAEKAADAG